MRNLAYLALAVGVVIAGCSSDDPTAPNSAPKIMAGPGAARTVIVDSETTIVSVTATDADGDDLTYTWSCVDGIFSGDGAIVVYQPAAVTDEAVHVVDVTVSDGNGGSVEGSVEVTVKPSVVIGATYRVRLNSLTFVQTGCDGIFDDDVEAFWNIQANDVSAVRLENDYAPLSFGMVEQITTDWAEADVLFNGTGEISIVGSVFDYDDLSANDMIGNWDLVYDTNNISTGDFSVSGGAPDGPECRVMLNYTIEKVADLRGAPEVP